MGGGHGAEQAIHFAFIKYVNWVWAVLWRCGIVSKEKPLLRSCQPCFSGVAQQQVVRSLWLIEKNPSGDSLMNWKARLSDGKLFPKGSQRKSQLEGHWENGICFATTYWGMCVRKISGPSVLICIHLRGLFVFYSCSGVQFQYISNMCNVQGAVYR